MVFFTIANLRRLLVYASDFLLKQRRMISWVTNLSIHLPQVPWWLPTTCARPKSASRRTATAATAATTRTSVTSSPSSSARTPACVSSFIYYSVFLLLGSVGLYSYLLLWIHFPLPPYFPPLCSAGLSPVLLFLSSLFSFLVSPFWPNISHCHARIVILLHYSETSHIAPPCRNVCTSLCSFVCVCVPKSCSRTPAPDLWQKAAFSSSPLTQRL